MRVLACIAGLGGIAILTTVALGADAPRPLRLGVAAGATVITMALVCRRWSRRHPVEAAADQREELA